MSVLTALGYVVVLLQRLEVPLRWPDRKAWRIYRTQILSTGVMMYFAQFGETAFFQGGILYLGQAGTVNDVGYLKLGIGIGLHLLTLSAAVHTVSLPLFTSAAASNAEHYAQRVTANFRSVWMLLVLAGAGVITFSREVVLILAGPEYLPAVPVVPWAAASAVFFCGYMLLGAKVFLPMNDDRAYALGFAPIVGLTALSGGLLQLGGGGAAGWALGMLIGSGVGFWLALRRSTARHGLHLLDRELVAVTAGLALAMVYTGVVESLWLRIPLFVGTVALSPYRSLAFMMVTTPEREPTGPVGSGGGQRPA
jgi:O-antigen/teichoic acid export membrane protein